MEKPSVEFLLSEVLEYSVKGDFQKTGSIAMNAPSMGCFKESTEFSQLTSKAFMDSVRSAIGSEIKSDVPDDKKDENPDADQVRMLLFSSASVSFVDISEKFIKLSGKVCEIDKGVFLNKDLVSKMNIDDYVMLICEYISNFTLPSLLSAREGSDPKKVGSK